MRSRQSLPCFVIIVGLLSRLRRDIPVDHWVDHWLDHRLAHPLGPLVSAYGLAGLGMGMPVLVLLAWLLDDWLPFGIVVVLARGFRLFGLFVSQARAETPAVATALPCALPCGKSAGSRPFV